MPNIAIILALPFPEGPQDDLVLAVALAAWQFIDRTHDPRLSMLRRFAKAMDVPLTELIGDGKRK